MNRLVLVDESGANTKMTRLRGRALGGQRLLARIPHGHYQTSTLIAGLRLGGACAPWLFGGAMNGEMFLAWVRQGLAPTLRTGDIVILDNLATHKIPGVRDALAAVGARLLYLPPYSPDFNPIEPMWSKIRPCAATLRVRKRNCFRRPRPPFSPFPAPIAKASFLAPDTLHNKWKFSR